MAPRAHMAALVKAMPEHRGKEQLVTASASAPSPCRPSCSDGKRRTGFCPLVCMCPIGLHPHLRQRRTCTCRLQRLESCTEGSLLKQPQLAAERLLDSKLKLLQ